MYTLKEVVDHFANLESNILDIPTWCRRKSAISWWWCRSTESWQKWSPNATYRATLSWCPGPNCHLDKTTSEISCVFQERCSKDVKTICPSCPSKRGLCSVPCFKLWHTQLHYWKYFFGYSRRLLLWHLKRVSIVTLNCLTNSKLDDNDKNLFLNHKFYEIVHNNTKFFAHFSKNNGFEVLV